MSQTCDENGIFIVKRAGMEDIMELIEIRKKLKKELDKGRYEHTKGVMYTAGCLAMAHEYSMEKAMLAEPEYKTAFVSVSEGTDAHLLGTALMAMADVAAVNISQDDMKRFSSMMSSMDLIVAVIILCAAGLAFIVLYNLTNINITERVREIATIEVLGFYENETAAYVFRENTILTFLGALVGLVLGIFLHRFVMSQIVVDMVSFDVHVKQISFLYSLVLTMVFTWFVDRLMRKKIDAISMTESLKSVD